MVALANVRGSLSATRFQFGDQFTGHSLRSDGATHLALLGFSEPAYNVDPRSPPPHLGTHTTSESAGAVQTDSAAQLLSYEQVIMVGDSITHFALGPGRSGRTLVLRFSRIFDLFNRKYGTYI
ncbi:BQ2448_2433 [Microbotryum intermedium]|uniref:BQ2448_2433 protein n=1 Tax=Microbotryum intermedium TaxID=269621 RepID=A0A238FBM6_9BASI|nr:BQ2448_2433 [Microbotryum intermedium]